MAGRRGWNSYRYAITGNQLEPGFGRAIVHQNMPVVNQLLYVRPGNSGTMLGNIFIEPSPCFRYRKSYFLNVFDWISNPVFLFTRCQR